MDVEGFGSSQQHAWVRLPVRMVRVGVRRQAVRVMRTSVHCVDGRAASVQLGEECFLDLHERIPAEISAADTGLVDNNDDRYGTSVRGSDNLGRTWN